MSNEPELLLRVKGGDALALSKLCRRVEEGVASLETLDAVLSARAGHWTIGVTGSPGAGKSTLVNRLVTAFRQHFDRVGVIAVDPTSPFSGGAILGDRIRMQGHIADPGVFIRSLATRGALGGLAVAAEDCASLMGLWGAGVVLLETVGVGQAELDVMEASDSVVVVMAPGMGDDVQAAKAGILEIADLLVVNKDDQPGAARTLADLQASIALSSVRGSSRHVGGHAAPAPGHHANADAWNVRLLSCCAEDGRRVDQVAAALLEHRAWLSTPHGQQRTRIRTRASIERRLERTASALLRARHHASLERLADDIATGRRTFSAALGDVQQLFASIAATGAPEPNIDS